MIISCTPTGFDAVTGAFSAQKVDFPRASTAESCPTPGPK
jgi:hypothetical protein